jgi:phage terminase Nu1 subunit (DNA packaging protein)
MTMKINDNGVDRDMTEAELSDYEAWALLAQTETAALAQADADRQALKAATLAKLGLTADEVAALLS